jgi:hypothetical protein
LSDALHASLLSKYVEVRQKRILLPSANPAFAKLSSMRDELMGASALDGEVSIPAATIESTEDAELEVGHAGQLLWQGRTVAFLRPGRTINTPSVALRDTESAAGPKLQRLSRYLRERTRALHEPLRPLRESKEQELRALAVSLESGLGALWTADFGFGIQQLLAASEKDPFAWQACGMQVSPIAIYAGATATHDTFALRCALTAIYYGLSDKQLQRVQQGSNLIPHMDIDARALLGLGFAKLGRAALRVDLAVHVLTEERLRLSELASEEYLEIAKDLCCSPAEVRPLFAAANEQISLAL